MSHDLFTSGKVKCHREHQLLCRKELLHKERMLLLTDSRADLYFSLSHYVHEI